MINVKIERHASRGNVNLIIKTGINQKKYNRAANRRISLRSMIGVSSVAQEVVESELVGTVVQESSLL